MKTIILQLQHNQITLAGAQLEVSSVSSYCEAIWLTDSLEKQSGAIFLLVRFSLVSFHIKDLSECYSPDKGHR